MRFVFLIAVALAACSANPTPTADGSPCGGACGPGTMCEGGRCVAADAAALDAPDDRPTAKDIGVGDAGPIDAGVLEVGLDAGQFDVAVLDAGFTDLGPADTGADVLPDGCASSTVGNCCGVACTGAAHAIAVCGGGACGLRCTTDFSDCDRDPANGCEVAHTSSDANCGRCDNACTMGQHCIGGACQCPVGQQLCGGLCSDTQTDTANCGACGAPCASDRVCVGAACVPCPAGQVRCGGACVTLSTDALNCNGCDNRCPSRPNATPLCVGGACSLNCEAGYANCDGDPANGCETNTAAGDPNNCGRCGGVCAAPVGTIATCAASRCSLMVSACPAGTGNCDGTASNGCETNTNTTIAHCGRCGASCALRNAVASCVAGACVVRSCNPGYVDCDGDPATGCESYPPGDYLNCGSCGRPCPIRANSGPVCRGGACGFICYAGWGDCNRDPSDGCEQNINPVTLGSTTCNACGTRCSNQCYDLQTTSSQCGACGRTCTGSYFCQAGTCVTV